MTERTVHMVIRPFNKDQVIFREKEQGDCFYQMKSGSVGIYKNYETSEEEKNGSVSEELKDKTDNYQARYYD